MRPLRKYPNGGDIKDSGELPQINLTASRANWEKQKELRKQLAQTQQDYNNLISDYGLKADDQAQFGFQDYQGGMSSTEELQAKINKLNESYKNVTDQFASANRALADLRTAYPDEWNNKTVSDVITPAGLAAMRKLKIENNAYDNSLRDYYANYGSLVDPNTQYGYGPGATYSAKETRENWMEDVPDFVSKVNKLAMAAPLLGGGAAVLPEVMTLAANTIPPYLTAPLTIGSKAFPLINPINTIGLGFGAHSAANLADPNSASRQSISRAYQNPTTKNILDATGNVTMDALGVLTSPGMGNMLLKAGQGIANTPRAIGNLYEDVATGNSLLTDFGVPVWKLEKPIISPKSSDYIVKNYTDDQIKLLDKYGKGMKDLTPKEWQQLEELRKSGVTDFSQGNFPISRVIGYYAPNSAENTAIQNLKRGEIFNTPTDKSIRTWSAGIPKIGSHFKGKTRLVIPRRYTKNLGSEFAGMPYYDKRSQFIWDPEFGLNKNAVTEKELIGNVPNGFKVIGKVKQNGLDNIIIKPINAENTGLNNLSNYLTTQTPLQNLYKINPFALKENPEMFLYRTQPKDFVAGYTEEQQLKDLITDKILKGEKVPFYLQGKLNKIKYQPEPFRKALDEYHGQWFDKNPERMDFYMKDRLDGDEGNILRLKVPKEEGLSYNLKNFPEAQKASLNYDTEFIVPRNKINESEIFGTKDWQQLVQEDKAFNTPHWLKGYKQISTNSKINPINSNERASYLINNHSTVSNPNIQIATIGNKKIPLNNNTGKTLQEEYVENLKAYYDSPEFKRIMKEHYPDVDIETYKATTLENLQKELTVGEIGEKNAAGVYFSKNSSGVNYPAGYTPSFAERVVNANTNPQMYSGRGGTSIVSDTGATWHELGHQRTNNNELLPDFLTKKYLQQNSTQYDNPFYEADNMDYFADPSEFEVRLKQLKEDLKTEGIADYFQRPISAEDIKKSSAFRLKDTQKNMIREMRDVRKRMEKLGASSEDLKLLSKTFNKDVDKVEQIIRPYSTETQQLIENWSPSFLAKMAGRIPLTIPGVIGGGFLANQQLNKTYKSGGSLAPNIPTYYNFKGTPIYRDTTALPFASGGMLDGPPDNPVLPSLKNLNTNEVSALLYNTVANIIERKKAEGKIKPGENLDLRGVVAQILLESGNAKSGLTAKYNNFGGLRATQGFIDRGGKTVSMVNKATGKKFLWRAYDTPEQGLEAQIDFLLDNPRYRKAGVFNAKNTQEYLAAVSKAGYAGGEPTYARKVNQMAKSLDKRLKKVTPEKLQELNQTYNVSPTLQPIGVNTTAPINQAAVTPQVQAPVIDPAILAMRENLAIPAKSSIDLLKEPISQLEEMPSMGPELNPPSFVPDEEYYMSGLPTPKFKSRVVPFMGKGASNYQTSGGLRLPYISGWNQNQFINPIAARVQQQTDYDPDYYYGTDEEPGEYEKASLENRPINFEGGFASKKMQRDAERYLQEYDQYNQLLQDSENYGNLMLGRQFKYGSNLYERQGLIPSMYASSLGRYYGNGGKFITAGGEYHRVYKNAEGDIIVNHPKEDKGQWDTINLTDKANSKTVSQGVAATKKWHRENPNTYSNGGKIDYSMYDVFQHGTYANGGMIKRADGSYSKRGLWDNIRANAGSGKKPTKEMLAQERKINNQKANGGYLSSFKASNIQTY
jgi:hypothetical protein